MFIFEEIHLGTVSASAGTRRLGASGTAWQQERQQQAGNESYGKRKGAAKIASTLLGHDYMRVARLNVFSGGENYMTIHKKNKK